MWALDDGNPSWEFVARAAIVFAFLMILLRIAGKRQIGQMTPFDLVLLLILSNAVQNSMNAGDNSVTAGLILATTLVAINYAVSWVAARSKTVERLLEGRPVILIHNGHVDRRALEESQMTHHDLEVTLRAAGYAGPHQVRYAVLETTGRVSVIPLQNQPEEQKLL
jgi:uncharacterized membrane protein YcaP (DUF421 family)